MAKKRPRATKHAARRRKPGEPPRISDSILAVRARVASIREMLASGVAIDQILDWCEVKLEEDKVRGIVAKDWAVGRAQARNYVDRALESIGSEDTQTSDRKRARNRALTTILVQRLMATGSVPALSAALRGADQLCKIDGSYEPELGKAAAAFIPATQEEAEVLIAHAARTLELAKRRGAAPALTAPVATPPQVIDVHDDETEDDGPGIPDGTERPRDAN